MIKVIIVFFFGLVLILVGIVYFAGQYKINPDYFVGKMAGKEETARNLIVDSGTKDRSAYKLTISSTGDVEYGTNKTYQTQEIILEKPDMDKINSLIDVSGVFKLFTLNRTFCLSHYKSTLAIDYGWINKKIDYSNCADDPDELITFRKSLYQMLGIEQPAVSQ